MQTLLAALVGFGVMLGSAGGLVQEGSQPREDDGSVRRQQATPPRAPMHIEATSILRVRGEATATATPDRATVSVGVVAEGRTAAEAQRGVNSQLDRVLQSLRALNDEDMMLQTQSVSLSPRYDHEASRRNPGTPPRIIGYRASNTIRVRVDDVALVGRVIDAAMEGGANTISGISFQLKDDTEQRAQALADAADRAREKARVLSRATGVRITGIIEIAEEGTQAIPFTPRGFGPEMMAARSSMDGGAQIEAGEIEVRSAVTITYRVTVQDGAF